MKNENEQKFTATAMKTKNLWTEKITASNTPKYTEYVFVQQL